MTGDTQVTFPCSVNSVPFYPSSNGRRNLDAMINYGYDQYIASLLGWQTKLPYLRKALFNEKLTFQFKTQLNSDIVVALVSTPDTISISYTNQAKLFVCKSKFQNGILVCGDEISGFTTLLNPAFSSILVDQQFCGMQSPTFDTYIDPITNIEQRLASYMWSFQFDDVLTAATNSGIYFVKFINKNIDGTLQTWFSEPILVFGTDAISVFPRTLLFETINYTNKNDILMDGWPCLGTYGTTIGDFTQNKQPVFRQRLEADILDFDLKGIYTGFIQENWLQENVYNSSWKTWLLNIGSINGGIPTKYFESIVKFVEMDLISINNQYYIYDMGVGGSSPTNAWKTKKPRAKQLIHATLPIRYKFENQFFAPSLSEDFRIFGDEFSDVFG